MTSILSETVLARNVRPLRERIFEAVKEKLTAEAPKTPTHQSAFALSAFHSERSEWFRICATRFCTLPSGQAFTLPNGLGAPKNPFCVPDKVDLHAIRQQVVDSVPSSEFIVDTTLTRGNISAHIDVLKKNADGSHTLTVFQHKLNVKHNDHQLAQKIAIKMWVASATRFIRRIEVLSINRHFVGPFTDEKVHKYFLKVNYTGMVFQYFMPMRRALAHKLPGVAPASTELTTLQKIQENAVALAEKESILHIPRISAQKIVDAIDQNMTNVLHPSILKSFEWSPSQVRYITLCQSGKPLVNAKGIQGFLKKFAFPRFFLDFESVALDMPPWSVKAYQQVPFQYSVHVQGAPGAPLEHFEYLHMRIQNDPASDPRGQLLQSLTAIFDKYGEKGTFLAHHASFEDGILAGLEEFAGKTMKDSDSTQKIQKIRNTLIDLELVFKHDYIDPRFMGSTSLKKIQPVLAPERSYGELEGFVSDGQRAADTYAMWVLQPQEAFWVNEQRTALLEYCRLDTQVMVDIVGFLEGVVRKNGEKGKGGKKKV